jgi:16S rRNA (guanine527-N7)-methyltransferase
MADQGSPGDGDLISVLQEAQRLGFLGGASLEAHLTHSKEFALALDRERACPSAGSLGPEEDRLYETGRPGSFLDLGTGGGVPGLVLASIWELAEGFLLDSNVRKTAFLGAALQQLGWAPRVSVLRSRAESAGRDPKLRGAFDVVVSRAFGPPAVTAECAAPLLRRGGWLVVSEPPPSPSTTEPRPTEPRPTEPPAAPVGSPLPNPLPALPSSRWPREPLAVLGLEPEGVWKGQYSFQLLRQTRICPSRFPRREGVPSKRPLFG